METKIMASSPITSSCGGAPPGPRNGAGPVRNQDSGKASCRPFFANHSGDAASGSFCRPDGDRQEGSSLSWEDGPGALSTDFFLSAWFILYTRKHKVKINIARRGCESPVQTVRQCLLRQKKEKAPVFKGLLHFIGLPWIVKWWRRWDSNPRPKTFSRKLLHAFPRI